MAHLQKDGELINIHNRESESVSSLIPSQMRGEAQVFIAFLEDYYKYLNQEDQATNLINRIATEHDIDFTGDSFLEEIRKEIAKGIPDSQALNNRQLFRRIVDYYYTRGSENSATVFFKLFFNDSATITYPKETLFKTSDGAIEEFGFVEDNGDNVGKLVRYSTVTGDFVEEKNTQAPAGLKPIQITTTDGNTSFNFVDGTYKFNFTNNRYEKEGQPQQFFIFNQALSRWEFVRNVYSFYYGYDNRGIIGEGNDNLIPATEKEGFWKVLSDGTTNNQSFWTFRASQTAGHPEYLVDIDGTLGNPTPGNDIRNESSLSSSFPLTNMARAVTTGEVFVTEDILVDSDHENEYFCHNSNLKDTFWTYDKANVSEDKNLKFHIELIREKKNHIRYPLTHWATDRTTVRKSAWNTETGYQGADESGFKYLDDFHIGAFGINQEQVHTTKLVSSAVSRRHQINFPSEIKRTHKLTITQDVDSTKIDVTLDEGSMHDLTPNGEARLDRDCYFIYRDGVELAQLSATLSKSNVVGNKCRLTFSGSYHTSLNFATGQKIEIHQRIGEFKPNKRYVLSGTISILAEGNGGGTPGGTEGFASFLGLSNATQGFNHSTSSGSEHVAQSLDIVGGNTTGNVFIKDPDNTAANKRGLAINSGETTVGDFEVIVTKDDTTSGVLAFVSNNSTPFQIDNLRLVEEKTNDEFPTVSTVDRDAEYEYHPDYDKDKQAALFINAGDFDASFTSEFSQLQHNDVLSSEKVSSQAEIAATASSARSFKICREINKFPLMTRFTTVANNVWDTGTYGYRVPDSDHPTPSAAVSAKYNFKVTRLKRNAKINQSDFTVNNFSNVTLTLDNKSGGNLEVGQTVSGGKIRRGSVIESISAQAGSTATIVISPQITHVFRVLSDSNANTVKVELIEGSLDCIDGTLGTNLECQKNGSAFGGTAVISAPTNIVQVGLSRRVTCTLNFNSAQNVTAGDKLEFVKHHTIYDNTVLRFADVTLQLRDSESAINVTAGEGIRTTGLGTNQHRLAIDVSDLALRWPGEDFQLGTYENDTIIYGKDSKGVVTTLMEKANFPTRKVTSSTASAFNRISIPDKTILLSNGKGFGVGNNGHDNAVLPLNNYGKEFGFYNYRSDNRTHLQGYALDNAKIEFYEIEIPTEIGWERASNSFDLYAEQLFLFGPEAQPTKIIRGPTASLSDARTDTDLGNGGRKLRYKYEVLKGGDYSSVINQFTGIIQRDGKTIPPNERTALRVGDIFVGQPGDTGEKKLRDSLLVKPAPSEILNVKSGDYFSITPRGGLIPRNALLDNDVSPSGQRANRNYFYIIKSSGNVVASISSGGNIVDNIVLSPASNRILQRSSFGTDYTLSGLSYDKGSGNGRDSNGTEIRTAQTKFNYENSQTGTISRNVFKLNANVTNATALVCSSSGGANHDGATTDAGPLYTGQYLRVATGYIINGVDNTNTASIATLKGHIRAGMRVEMLASNVTLSNSSTPITISSVSDYVNAGENNSTATIGLSQDITITGSINIYVEFYTQITNIADRGTAVTNALTSANVTVSPAITTTGTNGSSQLALGLYYGGLISGDANRFVFKTSKAPLYSQGGWVPVKDAALYSGSTATHTILNQYANNRVYLDNALTNREHGDTDTYIHKLKSAIVLTLPGTSHYVYHYFGAEKRGRVRQLTPRTLSGTTGIPLYNPNDDDLEFFATDSVFQVYYDTSAQGHLNSTVPGQHVASATKRISFDTSDDAKLAARKGKMKVGMFADFGSYAGGEYNNLPLVVTAVHDDGDFDLTNFASEVAWYITHDAPLVEFYTPGEQTFENTNLILRDKTQAYVNFTGVTRGKTDTYYVESMLEPAFSQSFADSSGGDGTSHVPVEKCKDTYVVPHPISDWSAYTTYSNSWNVYYWDSGWRLYQTHSRPFARGGAVQSQFIPVGGPASGSDAFITATAQGGGTITPNLWKFEGERPFALFVNDEENDEELVYGFNRNTYNQLSYNFYSDYENRKGRISDVNKIHDGNFNQEFSYGLNTGVSLDKWEAEYRKLVHPSGLKFFALLSVEPKVLRTANGSATYELTIGDDWLNNLQLPVGQHSPTFQPGWLDEVLTSVVDIEPLVQAGATLQDATNIVEQILASTYVLSSAKSNGITTITLTTKFVETETLIQMKTTNLTSFPKPIGIRSEDLEAAGLSRSQVTLSQTIEDSPGIFKAVRLGNRVTGGSESAPTSLTYDTTADGHIITLKINGGTAVSTGSSALNRSAAINQIRIRNGLVSGRKYKVTGQIKVTHNSLTNNADLDVGADIGDAYVTENPGGSNRNTSSQGTNGLYFRTLAAGAVDSDFVSFEVTGTHSSTYPGGSGDGSRNFVDINITAQSNGDSTMNLSNIQVQFKNLKIQEFYTTNEKIIFNNSFDTKVTRGKTNPGTNRTDTFGNFTSWHNQINSYDSGNATFVDYQPLDVPRGANVRAEIINLKPISNNTETTWSKADAANLYGVPQTDFPTTVDFNFD